MSQPRTIDSQQQAARHPICHRGPAVRFTSGALLGNGGMGVVVCVRPESVVLHFGHNSVWDIRLAENNRDALGAFDEIFQRVSQIKPTDTVRVLQDDPWYSEYLKLAQENYRKPYPRPMPCGSVILGFDRRRCETLGYKLDISRGLCRVDLLHDGQPASLEVLVEPERDRLWARCVDADGQPRQPFWRVRVLPDPDTPAEFPEAQVYQSDDGLGFTQVLPRVTEPGVQVPGPDHRFRLLARWPNATLETGRWPTHKMRLAESVETTGPLERIINQQPGLSMVVDLDHIEGDALPDPPGPPTAFDEAFTNARQTADASWGQYWNRSAVALDDEELEAIWYRNLYFLRCATRPGVTCPGLFANWSYRDKGSSWHGDYHMNYNTQQPFWVTFSSNHLELNLPYVDMVEHLLPMSRNWASEYYKLRGAYFPHSAYPVPMTMNPYPVPHWGWEIFETPWTVQGLWWHYTYSMDTDFLRDRAFGPIREACQFLADYMRRPEARGERFGDDRYHVFPTVAPELYGLRIGFDKNHDSQTDLTLIRFIFRAFGQACATLNCEDEHRELLDDIAEVMAHFPDNPTVDTPDGPVWVAVPGGDADLVHNCPASTMTIFPGEEVGLHSPPEDLALARRTLAIQQNEGGNELVFLNLQRARAGVLDIEKFKRQVHYCTLPNGTSTDMVLQTKGRYPDEIKFEYMADMGIWLENFALPAVINECLMQSWDGVIDLFPNWPAERNGAFENLRAVGAFLVSAEHRDGQISNVRITSEAGGECRLVSPWPGRAIRVVGEQSEQTLSPAEVFSFTTRPGESLRIEPLD